MKAIALVVTDRTAVTDKELNEIRELAKSFAEMFADPRAWRAHQINSLIVDLGALNMSAADRTALWERLEQIDDVGIALLRKALKGLQERRATAS